VAIVDGRIAIGTRRPIALQLTADRTIDAGGCLVVPGLIDPHVHLREPGREEAETIATGTGAAVAGGFTTVCCMPNTEPAIDDDSVVEFIFKQAEQTGRCRVFPVGAISKGRRGEELAQVSLMARAGAVGFSDDGDVVASAGLMQRAAGLHPADRPGAMQHCQEPTLTRGASMHAGSVSTRLGLVPWPRVAEEVIIERDVRLNRGIGCRYHVQHLSSARQRGDRPEGSGGGGGRETVTAEASPHHLLLTHDEVDRGGGYWTQAKMNPPLREKADIDGMREGIADGTITVLATDHAPHTAESKELEFEAAPFGIIGLETALGLYSEALVTSGVIDWARLIAMMTVEPARLCNLDRRGLGRLAVGGPADVTIINPEMDWTIAESDLSGKGRNTPFLGRRVRGRATVAVVAGEVRWELRA
jgi:dihydroorotase